MILGFCIIAAFSVSFAAIAFIPSAAEGRRLVRGYVPVRPLLIACMAVSGAVLAARLTFKFLPALEAGLMPVEGYAVLERDAWIPAVPLLVASFARLIPARRRPAFTLPLVILVGVAILAASWRLDEPSRQLQSMASDGVCLQSTGYTCAAAASVTLLDYHGVAATEGEMAGLGRAHPRMGTSCFLAARALSAKLRSAGLAVSARVVAPGKDGLDALPAPFLAGTRYTTFANHMVCVLRMDGDEVEVADPLAGREFWTRSRFLEKWNGVAVIVR